MNQEKQSDSDKIKDYLDHGGLFNPELMDHQKVRDMIMECSDEIKEKNERIAELESQRYGFWNLETKKKFEKLDSQNKILMETRFETRWSHTLNDMARSLEQGNSINPKSMYQELIDKMAKEALEQVRGVK